MKVPNSFEDEIWQEIPDNPRYLVSNYGRIYSMITAKLLKLGESSSIPEKSYSVIRLPYQDVKKTYKVHRLVAELFIPNPDSKELVNHKDGNKKNNFVENLEWNTHTENAQHAWDTGLMERARISQPKGEDSPNSKLTLEQVEYIRRVYTPRHPEFGARALARELGVTHRQVGRIANNQSWVTKP